MGNTQTYDAFRTGSMAGSTGCGGCGCGRKPTQEMKNSHSANSEFTVREMQLKQRRAAPRPMNTFCPGGCGVTAEHN